MKNNQLKDELLENAIKISTKPHRLYENDIKYDEYWAETFVSQNSIYQYLPLGRDFSLSIMVHERTHFSDNEFTRFKFMTFLRDFINELPNLEYFSEVLHFYEHNVKYFNIKELNNFLNYEWRNVVEASATIEQLQSFYTPDILASAIIDELKLLKKEILAQASKIVNITDKILQKMDKPSGWGKDERLIWAYHVTNALDEFKWIKRYRSDIGGKDGENLIILRAMRSMIREMIIQTVFSVAANVWDSDYYPPLHEALNYLDGLSETEIPKWSSPFRIFDFLIQELKINFKTDPYHGSFSFLNDTFLIFNIFLQLIQNDIYNEILKKYFYGLLSLIAQPIIPNCSFPIIWYFCRSREDGGSVVTACSEIFAHRQPIQVSLTSHKIGRILGIQMNACRKLLVIRNNLLKKCNISCIGQKDCPIKDEFYFKVKNAWKPLIRDVKDWIHRHIK